jgi:hypothetical protein
LFQLNIFPTRKALFAKAWSGCSQQHIPSCKGDFHDVASTTVYRGHAGAELFACNTGVLYARRTNSSTHCDNSYGKSRLNHPNDLYKIERGNPIVSAAAYATVMFVLGMIHRLAEIADAKFDEVGRSLEEERLPKRIRLKFPYMSRKTETDQSQ